MKGNKQRLQKLLRPLSVAVIGATDTAGKVGAVITRNILSGDFVGRVICVNPRRTKVFDQPCVPSLEEAGENVDCAIVVVPAELVASVVRESAARCTNFVVIAAGFGEVGAAGRAREDELLALAQELDITILGPNCLGFIMPSTGLNASFAGGVVRSGGVALLSQSGAVAVAMMDAVAVGSRGFSGVVSLGNKMQVSEVELMEFFADDTDTRVIGMYSESIGDGAAWMAIAQQVVASKPIVMLKSGRSEIAGRAIALHTGAMVGRDEVIDAMCRRVGVMRADSFVQFQHLLAFGDVYGAVSIAGGVAIVTNAGGFGVLATDACAAADLQVAQLAGVTTEMLETHLPTAASTANPIDVLGDADVVRYDTALTAISDDPAVGAVIVIVTPQEQTPVMDIARLLVSMRTRLRQPIIVSLVGGVKVADAIAYLRRNNVVVVPTPTDGVAVLAQVARAERDKYTTHLTVDNEQTRAGQIILARAREEGRSALYYHEVQELATGAGIAVATAWRMDYHNPRDVQFPCVVKVDAPDVLHKTDVGGVLLNITTPEQLTRAVDKLHHQFGAVRVIAQQMAPTGQEIIIGATRDAVAGPVVMIGYGGIYAEAIDMTILLSAPVTAQYIERTLVESRLGFLFRTTRGAAPYDVVAVAQVAAAVGQMMITHEWIDAIDINPLIIYNNDTDAVAIDVKIVIKQEV